MKLSYGFYPLVCSEEYDYDDVVLFLTDLYGEAIYESRNYDLFIYEDGELIGKVHNFNEFLEDNDLLPTEYKAYMNYEDYYLREIEKELNFIIEMTGYLEEKINGKEKRF